MPRIESANGAQQATPGARLEAETVRGKKVIQVVGQKRLDLVGFQLFRRRAELGQLHPKCISRNDLSHGYGELHDQVLESPSPKGAASSLQVSHR